MFELDAFVIRGHEKVIDHYRWLRDPHYLTWSASASSAVWMRRAKR